jgi:DNA-binding transcriptional ArsR family regulator
MGTTKKHFYLEDQLLFSDLCKALGHPARISIVQMLSKNECLSCTDFQSKIQLSPPTISRHCKILHQHGIIGYEVIGNNCVYRLDNRVLDKLTDFVDTINVKTPSITGNVYYQKSAY